MKIAISIFFILVLALGTSKFKFNIVYLKKEKNSLKIDFNANIGLYLFGFFKIIGISFKSDGVHFLFFKIPYNKMKIDKDSMRFLKDFPVLDIFKSLHIKLNHLNLDLQIGTENMMLTVYSVFFIATIFSIISAKNAKKNKTKNYFYQITPIYNTNTLSVYLSSKFSVCTFYIIKALILAKKQIKQKNDSASFINKKIALKI